jgi:glycosyltransferase involved in cell wall biosynthesis
LELIADVLLFARLKRIVEVGIGLLISDNNFMPIVSVLMTAYNREKYIGEAIESVLASTLHDFELIIVDDCSKDNTVMIARNYAANDSRIKVFINDVNLGDYPNRNRAASYAKGKYLKYLDSDDSIFPFGLEYCVGQMEKCNDACLGIYLVNHNITEEPYIMSSKRVIREHFFKKPYLNIGPSGTIIRRECFESNKRFDTRFKMASDNYFNLQMALKGSVIFLTKDFFHYRVHEGQEQNNPSGYLIFNYLYSREFLNLPHLPFTTAELNYLKRKLRKRHSVNLLKFLLKTKSLKKVSEAMISTDFTIRNLFLGVLN